MRPLPIRGSLHTQDNHQPNKHTSTLPIGELSQAATGPSRSTSTSPIPSHYACDSGNASSTSSPPEIYLSSSLETLEAQTDDHMNWSSPSPVLSTPNTSDTSASSSDSDTPSLYTHSIRLSDFLPYQPPPPATSPMPINKQWPTASPTTNSCQAEPLTQPFTLPYSCTTPLCSPAR